MKRAYIFVSVLIGLVWIMIGFLPAKAQENPYALQTQVIQNQQQLKLLQQQQAQLFLKIDNLLVKYGEIKGELDSLNHRLDILQQQINQLLQQQKLRPIAKPTSSIPQAESSPVVPKIEKPAPSQKPTNNVAPQQPKVQPVPADKKAFDIALNLYKQKKYTQAIEAFKNFMNKYKDSPLKADAIFYTAECYYNKGEYDKAIINYDYFSNTYPNNPKVAEAILKEGISFIKMGDKVDGNYLLQKVIKKYPNTKEAARAKKILKGKG
ncbi:tol-pal system protein YbgF [Hippea alviniae]|uniref:tol-pal system protein YbgF n=1 Tax=Hippea alviniae TaxID=1279027 RepID=UPI0003B68718|nr:tol-pal system protein YbgF [Hippea alviniae]